MKKKVLFTDGVAPEGKTVLEKNSDVLDVEICKGLSQEELLEKIKDVDAVCVRSATKVTPEVLEAAKKLKVIGRAGIGIDNIDLNEATSRGVIVMNTPDGNAITTAEHSISLLMSAARMIPQANKSLWDAKWDRKTFVGTELFGKTAGVIGFGNMGKLVAQRLRGLKLDVIAYDPYVTPEVAQTLGVKLVDLDTLLKTSDVITLHIPLVDKTKYLINDEAFNKMKDGVILVNCARGGVVEEKALLNALENKKLKAVALDVFEQEPPEPDNPLLSHPLVVSTPHLGAQTSEAQRNVSIAIAQQVADYFRSGQVKNAINFPNLSGEEAQKIQPYADLGEKMATFLSQWTEDPISGAEIRYTGELADLDCRAVSLSVAKGLLRATHPERANYVNALSVAKESGLKIEEAKSKTCEEFHSMIEIKCKSKKGESTSISGTLFGKKEPRLVRINDLGVESAFAKRMLVVENEDKPGVVGSIGKHLGDHRINIENMHLALKEGAGKALSLISITDSVSEPTLEALKKLDFILSCKYIEL